MRNNATARVGIDADVLMASPWAFAASQLGALGPLAAPLWIFGLSHLLCARTAREHSVLGWTFAVVFVLLAASGRGSIYYLIGAFPIVFAAGGVATERLARKRVRHLPVVVCILLCLQAVLVLPIMIPVVGADEYLAIARRIRGNLGADPQEATLPPVYPWMLGGPEITQAVAEVAETLSDSDRERAAF